MSTGRLETYLAAYAERFGRRPRAAPEYHSDDQEDPVSLLLPVAVPGREVLSANDRYQHWGQRARGTQRLRDRGRLAYRLAGSPHLEVAVCTVPVCYPDRRKRDVANLYNTAKAILDGMVGAGLLPDDDDAHLSGPWLHHDPDAVPPVLDVAMASVPAAARPFLFLFTFDAPGT